MIPEITATDFSWVNFMQLLVSTLLLPVIGWLLINDFLGFHHLHKGIYEHRDYMMALSLLPMCVGLSFVLCFFIREPAVQA